MREYKNKNYTVKFKNESEFTVENIFGDIYHARLDENNQIVAYSARGLAYALKARNELKF